MNSEGREVLVRMCPGCDAHLGDTWDEEAGECQRCGFAYIRERLRGRDDPLGDSGTCLEERREESQQRATSSEWSVMKRIFAFTFTVLYAIGSLVATTDLSAFLALLATLTLWTYVVRGGGS